MPLWPPVYYSKYHAKTRSEVQGISMCMPEMQFFWTIFRDSKYEGVTGHDSLATDGHSLNTSERLQMVQSVRNTTNQTCSIIFMYFTVLQIA